MTITLNGSPARIINKALKFPIVEQIETGLAVEYSQSAIDYVLTHKKGQFKS